MQKPMAPSSGAARNAALRRHHRRRPRRRASLSSPTRSAHGRARPGRCARRPTPRFGRAPYSAKCGTPCRNSRASSCSISAGPEPLVQHRDMKQPAVLRQGGGDGGLGFRSRPRAENDDIRVIGARRRPPPGEQAGRRLKPALAWPKGTGRVRSRISISSPTDQVWIYSRSLASRRSSAGRCRVSPLWPRTCASPVIPGFTLWRSR